MFKTKLMLFIPKPVCSSAEARNSTVVFSLCSDCNLILYPQPVQVPEPFTLAWFLDSFASMWALLSSSEPYCLSPELLRWPQESPWTHVVASMHSAVLLKVSLCSHPFNGQPPGALCKACTVWHAAVCILRVTFMHPGLTVHIYVFLFKGQNS